MFGRMLMFVGTYTRHTASEGIYTYEVRDDLSRIRALAVGGNIDNPSYLVAHPGKNRIYAVNETGDYEGRESGAVSALSYKPDGELELLNRAATLGADPCHLAIDRAGTFLMVSNYSGGSLAAFAIEAGGHLGARTALLRHTGSGVDAMRQKQAHVHSATLNRAGTIAWVADLGTDELIAYRVGRQGRVITAERRIVRVKPGAGPRHFCLDSNERYGYLINELDNTVVSFELDDTGTPTEVQSSSTLPEGYTGTSYCADIHVSPDDRFLYGSNRGHDSIVVYKKESDGRMSLTQHQSTGGRHPRNFCLTPDGRFLLVANRDSDNVVVFERDRDTGLLTETGTVIEVPAPVCILFV